MAIFEKLPQIHYMLDDTDNLVCTLENAQNINKHTEYILRIQGGPSKEHRWTVSRRYRDFASLHLSLQQANIDLPLPPKKIIGNMQPAFVAERQIALQNYIDEVLKHQILALSLPVRRFLDPVNFSMTIAEQALQTVSIALRGDGHYELKGPLLDINWRIRKHYFSVVDSEKTNFLLAWQSYGPDKHLHNKDLQTALKSLQNISHPYIDEILTIHALETGAYVVRRLHEKGSIRDLLYGSEYDKSYLSKYGNPKVRKPFTTGQIAHYGYQILQAIKFLHDKGLPHGHIHPGNIAIENQRVLLLDIENILLGVASVHRPYLRELRVATAEAVDVYSFGRTLYEIAFAEPLESCYCDRFAPGLFDDLESVLQMTLSSSSWKRGGATLEELLQHPFFTNALNGLAHCDVRGHLKFPLTLKEQIKMAVLGVEARLRSDQKLVRHARREVRIQEILGSEEEMRKQRRKAKKRDSIWKSTSSLAETVRSHSASSASSPTPPATVSSTGETSGVSPSASDGRGALLHAICSFDKKSLARVNSS